ncbi:hypothetical protein CASFOL_032137 [Castilleja foliolosa]|uniref:ZF-HD dimerization-type domain-containing protein n=1 Tax=Castilleja foliolosa TaxID=1961234 RepID=A0ABD3C2B6_9LAMI
MQRQRTWDRVEHRTENALKLMLIMGGKVDGCQEFKVWRPDDEKCSICNCHMNYHKKMVRHVTEVVYTECHKIHDKNGSQVKDGFRKKSDYLANICDACNCDKSFHRNEVTKEVITRF